MVPINHCFNGRTVVLRNVQIRYSKKLNVYTFLIYVYSTCQILLWNATRFCSFYLQALFCTFSSQVCRYILYMGFFFFNTATFAHLLTFQVCLKSLFRMVGCHFFRIFVFLSVSQLFSSIASSCWLGPLMVAGGVDIILSAVCLDQKLSHLCFFTTETWSGHHPRGHTKWRCQP